MSLGVTGAAASQTSARPAPRTLLTTKAPIHGFAQDTRHSIAWTDAHYYVHVRKLKAKLGTIVGAARDPSGIRFSIGPLALAGMQALWVSYSRGNFLYTEVRTRLRSPRPLRQLVDCRRPSRGRLRRRGPSSARDVRRRDDPLVFGAVGQRCDDDTNCRRLDANGSVDARDKPRQPTYPALPHRAPVSNVERSDRSRPREDAPLLPGSRSAAGDRTRRSRCTTRRGT